MPANAEEAKDAHWQVSASLSQLRHFYRPWSVFSLCQSLVFYCVCPPSISPICDSLRSDFRSYKNSRQTSVTTLFLFHSIYIARYKRFYYVIVTSLVDSAFLFFFSFSLISLIFSSSHVSTMKCLVCLWWAFPHSKLCFTTASISSMSLSLQVIVIKAGTHSPYRPTLLASVAQIPRR